MPTYFCKHRASFILQPKLKTKLINLIKMEMHESRPIRKQSSASRARVSYQLRLMKNISVR